jgi:hypothetical protein
VTLFAVVGWFTLFVGSVLLAWTMRSWRRATASKEWPTADGVVLRSSIRLEHSTDSDDRPTTSFAPHVLYQYVVASRVYKAERIAFGPFSGTRDWAERDLARYRVGERVNVHYDPNDPETAVLEPGGTSVYALLLAVGLLFVFVGGIFVLVAMLTT